VIATLWARASGLLAAVGAVLAALAAAWWAGRRASTTSARTRALEAESRTRETRDAVSVMRLACLTQLASCASGGAGLMAAAPGGRSWSAAPAP